MTIHVWTLEWKVKDNFKSYLWKTKLLRNFWARSDDWKLRPMGCSGYYGLGLLLETCTGSKFNTSLSDSSRFYNNAWFQYLYTKLEGWYYLTFKWIGGHPVKDIGRRDISTYTWSWMEDKKYWDEVLKSANIWQTRTNLACSSSLITIELVQDMRCHGGREPSPAVLDVQNHVYRYLFSHLRIKHFQTMLSVLQWF